MKKVLCVMLALCVVNTAVFAVDLSIGGSFGIGAPMLSGDDYAAFRYSDIPSENVDKEAIAIAPQVNVLVEFIPFLALETGLGFKYSHETFSYTELGLSAEIIGARSELSIPVLVRGQYGYDMSAGAITSGLTYLAAGFKLGIPTDDYLSVSFLGITDTTAAKSPAVDVSLAVGQEFGLGEKHFLGLRMQFDINVYGGPSEASTFYNNYTFVS